MKRTERVKYLRVSLLAACNLNCFYCRPPQTEAHSLESPGRLEDFTAAIKFLYGMGVRKVRFTGGEPTLYRNLTRIVRFTRELDNAIETAITTNGLLLSRLAPELAEAGLTSANISLDTISRERFINLTGRDRLHLVIRGIESAVRHIPKVKLNCVLVRGVNDREITDMIRYADNLGVDIRFIEFMPTKLVARPREHFVSGEEIRSRLPFELSKVDTEPSAAARYFVSPELRIRVGFISPVSHSFCEGCNRLRLASDGSLYGCLFSRDSINLFSLLQQCESTEDAVRNLVDNKQYVGCPSTAYDSDELPSFVAIGG